MNPDTYAALAWFALCGVVSVCAGVSLWLERRPAPRSDYLAPWADRAPGDLGAGDDR